MNNDNINDQIIKSQQICIMILFSYVLITTNYSRERKNYEEKIHE